MAPFPASAADFSVWVIKFPFCPALSLGARIKDSCHPPADLWGDSGSGWHSNGWTPSQHETTHPYTHANVHTCQRYECVCYTRTFVYTCTHTQMLVRTYLWAPAKCALERIVAKHPCNFFVYGCREPLHLLNQRKTKCKCKYKRICKCNCNCKRKRKWKW